MHSLLRLQCQPKDIFSCFDRNIPRKLVECISDLLKYDPDARLTSRQCLEHPYLIEALPQNVPPMPPALYVQTLPTTPSKLHTNGAPFITPSASPRSVPPSHSHNSLPRSPYHPISSLFPSHIADATSSHRTAFVPSILTSTSHTPSSLKTVEHANDPRICIHPPLSSDIIEEVRTHGSSPWPSNHARSDSDQMDVSSPLAEIPEDNHAMSVTQTSTTLLPVAGQIPAQDTTHTSISKLSRFGSLGFGKKNSRWSLGMFGHGEKLHQQPLPPVDEVPGSSSTPSLKRTQSTNSDSLSATDILPNTRKDAKAIKREAERLQLEAEKQRRALAERSHREQARAVMQKRNQMLKQTTARGELEWKWAHSASLLSVNQRPNYDDLDKGMMSASGPIRQSQSNGKVSSPTLNAASGRYLKPPDTNLPSSDRWLPRDERLSKVRRRDFDDAHSMSSSDVHSTGRMSAMSSATVDSDPGPTRIRRPTVYGINRMTSASSLRTGRTSYDDFPTSARSSNSISLDHQFNEFNVRASVDTTSSVSGTSSPPPINLLSLSPSPNSWMHSHNSHESTSPYVVPPLIQYPSSSHKSYECNGQLYGHPPTDLIDPHAAINPIFKVVCMCTTSWPFADGRSCTKTPLPMSPSDHLSSPHSLPPFSHLEAVAEGEYPPLSPMSFHSPEDE